MEGEFKLTSSDELRQAIKKYENDLNIDISEKTNVEIAYSTKKNYSQEEYVLRFDWDIKDVLIYGTPLIESNIETVVQSFEMESDYVDNWNGLGTLQIDPEPDCSPYFRVLLWSNNSEGSFSWIINLSL